MPRLDPPGRRHGKRALSKVRQAIRDVSRAMTSHATVPDTEGDRVALHSE